MRLVLYALSSIPQKYWLTHLASSSQFWERNWQLRNEDTKVLGGEVSWTQRDNGVGRSESDPFKGKFSLWS